MKKYIRFLILAVLFYSNTSLASDYPPGYVVQTECQKNGPFKVCALNRTQGQYPRISIEYQGSLIKTLVRKDITIVLLSQRSGRLLKIPLHYNYAGPSLEMVIADPSPRHCLTRPYGTPAEQVLSSSNSGLPYCAYKVSVKPGAEVTAWEVRTIAQEEIDFVKDVFSHELGNLELSAVDEFGNWDSKYGSNYLF